MQKTIIISFFLLSSTMAANDILKKDQPIHISKKCSTKLLTFYGADAGFESRSSFEPSDLLKSSCTNFEDSCCLDEEFRRLTEISGKNLKQIHDGVQRARVALDLLDNLTEEQVKTFISFFSDDLLQMLSMTREDIEADLKFLYEDHKDMSLDLLNAYKMVEEFGAGLNCTICEAGNHSNFVETQDNLKMIFDFNYCYNLFNSPGIISTLEFLKEMKQLNTFTRLLGALYDVDIRNDFEDSYEKIEKVDQMRLSCLASVDDFSDDEQCAEMCIEIGRPNQSFLGQIVPTLSSFTVMVSDFYGPRTLFDKVKKDQTMPETPDDTKEAIQVLTDQWNVEFILPPSETQESMDLNAMKVDLAYESGWNFNEIRMKNWKAFTGSQGVLKAFTLVGLVISVFF